MPHLLELRQRFRDVAVQQDQVVLVAVVVDDVVDEVVVDAADADVCRHLADGGVGFEDRRERRRQHLAHSLKNQSAEKK